MKKIIYFCCLFTLLITPPLQSKKKKLPQETPPTEQVTPVAIEASAPIEKVSRKVTIENNITDDMLAYKYLLGKFKPETFSLLVNNEPIKNGEKKEITITNDTFEAAYTCKFENGRTSERNINFKVKPESTTLGITFNWKKKTRIIIDNAKPYEKASHES